jgi:hypothetical protein
VALYSGDGGPATQLDYPDGVAVDGSGNLIFTDGYDGRVRMAAG